MLKVLPLFLLKQSRNNWNIHKFIIFYSYPAKAWNGPGSHQAKPLPHHNGTVQEAVVVWEWSRELRSGERQPTQEGHLQEEGSAVTDAVLHEGTY